LGFDAEYTKKTNNNGEFNAKLTGYLDRVKLIYPSELIPNTGSITNTSDTTIYVTTASGKTVALSSGATIKSY
jgi:hypothetical protein